MTDGLSAQPPTLFLDLDDVLVLNSQDSYGGYDVLTRERPTDLWDRLIHPPSRLALLDALRRWRPKVVMTTSWTRFMPRETFVELFDRTGLELLTQSLHQAWEAPPLRGADTRREPIELWLRRHHRGEPYAIVDDALSGTGLAGSSHDLEGRVIFCQCGVGLHRGHLPALGYALEALPPVFSPQRNALR